MPGAPPILPGADRCGHDADSSDDPAPGARGFRGKADFLQFPSDDQIAGKTVLVIDEVWDSGTTIAAVSERIRAAGGEPVTAVLHYKPGRSRVDRCPLIW